MADSDWVQVLESIAGVKMTPEEKRAVVRHQQERERLLAVVFEGVKALVKLYYENYTDATELDTYWVGPILCQYHECMVDENLVFEAIRAAEGELNAAGGVESADGEGFHDVHTAEAYRDEEQA